VRLLVVEDDKDLNRQLVSALEQAGYAVDRAFDGEEGHFLGDTEPYDAVVLDIEDSVPPQFKPQAMAMLHDEIHELRDAGVGAFVRIQPLFDGTKAGAYVEADPVAPLGVYGRTKLEGERLIAEAGPRHVVFRTSWVHAAHGANFVRTILRLARAADSVRLSLARAISLPDIAERRDEVGDLALSLEAMTDAVQRMVHPRFGCEDWTDFLEKLDLDALCV
jgi:HAMP domain-containing protein